jgi:ribonuclease P protein component
MLPHRLRLSRATFPGGNTGKRAATAHFSMLWGAASHGGASAVVSKKVARRSVDRHLLKRRMLAVIEPFAAAEQFLVVYARAGSPTLSFKELQEELTTLLSRTNFHHSL